jgi:uncharacterized glyoxalase superfamily protein PhnB
MPTILAPNVLVTDVERSSRFYQAMGFAELDRVTTPEGTLAWAMLQREGQRFMIERAQPGQRLAATLSFYLSVDDLEAEIRRLAAGRIEHTAPETRPYGMREIAWRDPDGYDWVAGQQVAR